MADNKNGREKKVQNADRRQWECDVAGEPARGDDPEPPVDATDLAEFKVELESLRFPVPGADLVAAVGDREIGPVTEAIQSSNSAQ